MVLFVHRRFHSPGNARCQNTVKFRLLLRRLDILTSNLLPRIAVILNRAFGRRLALQRLELLVALGGRQNDQQQSR